MPGVNSVILGGSGCTANGTCCAVAGSTCHADGDYTFATGNNTTANGASSVALGTGCETKTAATASFAAGSSNTCKSPYCSAFGFYNQVGNETPVGDELPGHFGFAAGTNNIVLGQNAIAIGQSGRARARHSFVQGEDSESLSARPGSNGGESAVCLNHFNTAGARASTLMGCNNWSTGDGSRSMLHGFGAKSSRATQHAMAAGGFTPHSRAEDLFHTYAAGDAQTSRFVFRGQTDGTATGQTAGAVGLVYSPANEWLLQLDDGFAYAFRATVIAHGVTIVGAVETAATAQFKLDCVVRRVGSACSFVGSSAAVAASLGDASTSSWRFQFGTYDSGATHGLTLLMTTGTTKAKLNVCAKLEMTEVIKQGTRADVAGLGYDLENSVIVSPF